MSEQTFPTNWLIGQDYDPNAHMLKLERYNKAQKRMISNDYLNVQNRLIWFIRDQRALIAAGLAKNAYVIETELVTLDRELGWAHYKTFIRDVLGNEATMYGSEAAASFPDYIEKASTKSLGRALLLLGYGTAYAPELDEGDRVVDSPVEDVPVSYKEAMRAGREAQEPTQAAETTSEKPTRERQPAPLGSVQAYLHRQGYATIDDKADVVKAAGLPWKSAKGALYSLEELDKLTAWVNAHPVQKAEAIA